MAINNSAILSNEATPAIYKFPSSEELLLTPGEGDVVLVATLQAEKQRSVVPFPKTHSNALPNPFRPGYRHCLLQGGPQIAVMALSVLSTSSSLPSSYPTEEHLSASGWARQEGKELRLERGPAVHRLIDMISFNSYNKHMRQGCEKQVN